MATHDATNVSDFDKVRNYLLELDISIDKEDAENVLFVVSNEANGVKNLVLDGEAPVLVLEQLIIDGVQDCVNFYKRLLQINRTLVHGAFVLDEEGNKLIFRDTLRLENLDLNELEGSIDALTLALAEYSGELLAHSKQ